MNPILQEILSTRQVRAANGEVLSLDSDISLKEGQLLQHLIAATKPLRSLEVGFAFGVSTLFILDALREIPGARHIVIDPLQVSGRWKGVGLENVRRAGYEHMLEFHALPSHIALPQLEQRGFKIDFAFIDGNHAFDYALVDFFCIDRLLRVGGIVAFDDADWPSVRKLCRFIATNREYEVLDGLGFAVEAKASVKDRLLCKLARLSKGIRRALRPEFLEPDLALGLAPDASCIAFRKTSDDVPRWDRHREF